MPARGSCGSNTRLQAQSEDAMADEPTLSIPLETICFIITKAREFDAKDEVSEPDPGSNPSDDDMRAVLEDHADDPVVAEITAVIDDLNEDAQLDLVTLVWLGRGDGDLDSWGALRGEAVNAYNGRTADYLLGIPLLADYLEEALAQFGLSCASVQD
ncbi:DUF3775 domain-containing protein [Acidocella sp. KAb 2-4]|uniref:DUF3775 domain-containing protein n=1 Tax=Acidocella sp. KAb 2-4 TaxID=2885158 RepID=UPI001D07D319|nr:DUF3775 domain-containing protein [Acidocella sp. KAb 2-4]MCB5945608.1 DUF3775 domain-containing protein [Acidocella sp. KAb 2-4]